MYKRGHLPIYTNQVTVLLTRLGRPLTLARPTSHRENPKIHFIILNWGLFPQLTTKVVAQGLDTIKTSRKEANTSPMGVQQHTMIIYIEISSKVTNTKTLSIVSYAILELFMDVWDLSARPNG